MIYMMGNLETRLFYLGTADWVQKARRYITLDRRKRKHNRASRVMNRAESENRIIGIGGDPFPKTKVLGVLDGDEETAVGLRGSLVNKKYLQIARHDLTDEPFRGYLMAPGFEAWLKAETRPWDGVTDASKLGVRLKRDDSPDVPAKPSRSLSERMPKRRA